MVDQLLKIHIDRFSSNNEKLTFDDILSNFKAGITKEGIINVHFETKDKYVEVDARGTSFGPDYSGMMITITPYLYDGDRSLERGEDEYYAHPDYWMARLVVEPHTKGLYYDETVIALKHEYFVSYVPNDMVMNYECLQEVELIEWEE